jgi:transketolase
MSLERGTPLSTLKFNARRLKHLGLIEVNDRGACLTSAGRLIVSMFDDGASKRLDVGPLKSSSSSLKERLAKLLERINGFHLASSLSCLDVLMVLLEGWLALKVLNVKALVLSKGHAAPALYVAMYRHGLLHERELEEMGELGSRLQTHAEPGSSIVAVPTGSLGQGLSVANGIAMAMRMRRERGCVYALLGDGELDEGQVWEAAATASSHGLDNVIAIVDRNGHQLAGPTEAVKRKEPLRARWEAFGWDVAEADGHDHELLLRTLIEAELSRNGRPKVVIARTGGAPS